MIIDGMTKPEEDDQIVLVETRSHPEFSMTICRVSFPYAAAVCTDVLTAKTYDLDASTETRLCKFSKFSTS